MIDPSLRFPFAFTSCVLTDGSWIIPLCVSCADGVAPRAKMNQQRARRFCAAREVQESKKARERLREEFRAQGKPVPEIKGDPWDSNVITPGTEFLARLSRCLKFYIQVRLHTHPGWKGLKVIFSDAQVPGEGEHKIMDFIRQQRAQPDYDPDTVHVLYGMDADLIMLALATHEPHFHIFRESVDLEGSQACFICGQQGHMAFQCKGQLPVDAVTGEVIRTGGSLQKDLEFNPYDVKFEFLSIDVLREYLQNDLWMELPDTDGEIVWDLERAIDDWVFLCFFVGNDFLPELPVLSIREGAIDLLVEFWKMEFLQTAQRRVRSLKRRRRRRKKKSKTGAPKEDEDAAAAGIDGAGKKTKREADEAGEGETAAVMDVDSPSEGGTTAVEQNDSEEEDDDEEPNDETKAAAGEEAGAKEEESPSGSQQTDPYRVSSGYLTDRGRLHFGRVLTLVSRIAELEDRVFTDRFRQQQRQIRKNEQMLKRDLEREKQRLTLPPEMQPMVSVRGRWM